ncbi:Yip1 family protein [Usitatibacter palustris]|uniref:Yip1 domain-containing protein n=1 Tax=Usitatibacter palustris TaxID=2732487 RepID=A0A6M4H2T6_9PROT|nr:Yip1 family protein [Usitatibacter palustris]QJR13760.1 hypothetical protein DSM104440_00550 [Usitatibacter palustris]
MVLADRVKNILLTPKTEWDVIAGETTPTATLIKGYVLPLAAVAASAAFIGNVVVGSGFGFHLYRMPLLMGLVFMAMQILMAVVAVFVISFVINALAPKFGATQDPAQALKLAVYSCTAGWVAGVLAVLPMLGTLAIVGGLYGIYLLYLGLPKLMKCPEDQTTGYTVVVVLATLIVMVILNAIVMLSVAPAWFGAAAVSRSSGLPGVFDKDSPVGKLEEFGKKMEAAGKKMEAARKSGDTAQQGQAAMEALGTMMSGGKRAEPLSSDEMKSFLPATLAGLPKAGSDKSERTAMYSKVEATYGEGADKAVRLEITDSGGAAGLLGLAGWAGALNSDKENDRVVERTRKEGDRVVRERASKGGGKNEVSVILASRYIVEAESKALDVAALKKALSGVDLAKLESLKEKGVASS